MIAYDHLDPARDEPKINGLPIAGPAQASLVRDWFEHLFVSLTACPCCSSQLANAHLECTTDDLMRMDGEARHAQRFETHEVLWYCSNCRYWQYHHHFSVIRNSILQGCGEDACYISKLREFDERVPEECGTELSQLLRRSPAKWHSLDPEGMEKLVAEVFRANYAHADVMHVGRPDDGGIDVIFVDSAGKQWLIQVKRRESPSAVEGVATVRNLLGTMMLEGCMQGVVVSTADHFSYRAYEAAGRAAELGWTIRLVDKGKLDRMVGALLPQAPWMEFVKSHYPDHHDRFALLLPPDPMPPFGAA